VGMARPRKYKSPEDFDAMVDYYVASCQAENRPITWTGLVLALGFCSRSALDRYADRDGFGYSVKRAKLLVQAAYELRLHGNNVTGSIFALKAMGWSDKTALELTSPDGSMSPKEGSKIDLSSLPQSVIDALMDARKSDSD